MSKINVNVARNANSQVELTIDDRVWIGATYKEVYKTMGMEVLAMGHGKGARREKLAELIVELAAAHLREAEEKEVLTEI